MPMRTAGSDAGVLVVGAGVIGLAIAISLRRQGVAVTVFDPDPLGGSTWVAAGMLAPVTEAHYGEEALVALNLDAAARYPRFVAEIEEASGCAAGYRACGTLSVAFDPGDLEVLAGLHRFQSELGLESTPLGASECRQLEPMLSPAIRGGLWVEGDHQVDNRLLAQALLQASVNLGARIEEVAAVSVSPDPGHPEINLADGRVVGGDTVVLALGAWSSLLEGLPGGWSPPVRPVKGQILRLVGDPATPLLAHNLRGLVSGTSLYLVPRAEGRLVVGATVEERGFETSVTAGAVYELLRDAVSLVPGVKELVLEESSAGLRPGSPDNAPLIGPTGAPGVIAATGHYRNGILLAPTTAEAVADLVVRGRTDGPAAAFSPERFSGEPHGGRSGPAGVGGA
jgi:glycine oxidase